MVLPSLHASSPPPTLFLTPYNADTLVSQEHTLTEVWVYVVYIFFLFLKHEDVFWELVFLSPPAWNVMSVLFIIILPTTADHNVTERSASQGVNFFLLI